MQCTSWYSYIHIYMYIKFVATYFASLPTWQVLVENGVQIDTYSTVYKMSQSGTSSPVPPQTYDYQKVCVCLCVVCVFVC